MKPRILSALLLSFVFIFTGCADENYIGDKANECITTYTMNTEFCKKEIRNAGIEFDQCIDDCDDQLRIGIANAMGYSENADKLAGINAALASHKSCKEKCSTAFRSQLYEQGIVCHDNALTILQECTGQSFSAVDSLQQQ